MRPWRSSGLKEEALFLHVGLHFPTNNVLRNHQKSKIENTKIYDFSLKRHSSTCQINEINEIVKFFSIFIATMGTSNSLPKNKFEISQW